MENNKITKISVVIPIYNEEKNIKSLYGELSAIIKTLKKDYEIIFVDDCSVDSSLEILKSVFAGDNKVQVVSLLGNQGQATALKAGFDVASGDVVVAMDGDGQHDPQYIPQFVSAIEDGFDIASSWKLKDVGRKGVGFFLSKLAHVVVGKIVGVKMNYFGATMKAYRKDILRNLNLSGDLHRFAGALVYYKGIKIKEIPIEIRTRNGGSSHYGLDKIFKVALDLILIRFLTKHAKTPFRFFGSLGAFFSFVGGVGVFYVFILKYFFAQSAAQNVAGLLVSAICFVVGIQFVFFGLLAEMVSKLGSRGDNLFNIKRHLKHY